MGKSGNGGDKRSTVTRRPHLAVIASRAVMSHRNDLAIVAMYQIAELLLHLAKPISAFTSAPDRYCKIWHDAVGENIKGLREMVDHLDRLHKKVETTFTDRPKPTSID